MDVLQEIPLHFFRDGRGFVANLFEEVQAFSGDIQNFHVCSLNKGAVRGNHYHENAEEYILFLGGNARLSMEEMGTGIRKERLIKEKTGGLIKIGRKVVHAIKNEGEETLYILCFYLSRDPLHIETIRHTIVAEDVEFRIQEEFL